MHCMCIVQKLKSIALLGLGNIDPPKGGGGGGGKDRITFPYRGNTRHITVIFIDSIIHATDKHFSPSVDSQGCIGIRNRSIEIHMHSYKSPLLYTYSRCRMYKTLHMHFREQC